MALIDAAARSEQAVVETQITVLRLDRQAFDRMHIEHPASWDAIMRKPGIHLAVRLRLLKIQLATASAG